MTPKEIRNFLFEIRNQDLTIKELRSLLFDLRAHEKEFTGDELAKELNKKEFLKQYNL